MPSHTPKERKKRREETARKRRSEAKKIAKRVSKPSKVEKVIGAVPVTAGKLSATARRAIKRAPAAAIELGTRTVGKTVAEKIVLPMVSRAKTAGRIGKLLKGGPPKPEELLRRRKKATRAVAARAKKKKEAAVRTISMKDVEKLPLRGGQTEPPKKKKKRKK